MFGKSKRLTVYNRSARTVIDDPSPADCRRFQERLLAWWDANGRKDMPWQRDRTPYRVWVAEIMLQQTQVATVIPYYERFLARFPDVVALANADVDQVLHLWSGLGYYARARNLHRAAGIVAGEYGGVLPRTQEALMALPGIGRTTAAAIVAQAHDQRAAILDGNVKRVLSRHYGVGGASKSATVNVLWRLAERLAPERRVREYTQAIMDLGASVCARRSPDCDACPLRSSCHALASGDVERFPARTARRRPPLRRRRFFVLVDAQGACFVERRPPTGIWGGTWSPPERDGETSVSAFLSACDTPSSLVERVRVAPVFRHAFSHFNLDVEPVYVFLQARPAQVRDGDGAWIGPGEHGLGLSAVAAKLLATAFALDRAGDAELEPME